MKDTIKMARGAGMVYREFEDEFANANTDGVDLKTLKRFEELVRADAIADERDKWMERTAILLRDEREACAKVCDVLAADYGKAGLPMTFQALRATATEIRARGETK